MYFKDHILLMQNNAYSIYAHSVVVHNKHIRVIYYWIIKSYKLIDNIEFLVKV